MYNVRLVSPYNFFRNITAIVIILMLILPGNFIIVCNESASALGDITIISIQPHVQDVEKGETFTVDIYVEPSELIMGVGVDIYFDPTLIQADMVFESCDLFNCVCTLFDPGTIDNINGKITNIMGVVFIDDVASEPGYFVYISFTAQQELGTSPLYIQNAIIADINGEPLPSTVIDGEVTVTDYFTLTILYDGDGSGTVTKDPDKETYKHGTNIILEAFHEVGSDFSGWSGDISSGHETDNPVSILMDMEKYVTATFIKPPEITDVTLTESDPLDTEPGFGWENFTCTVTDDVSVDEVLLVVTYPDTTTIEYPMINIPTTDTYSCNTTLSEHGDYIYYICANDTGSNENVSVNNNFWIPVNWDVDMNGTCGFWDLVMISFHYGEVGTPGWIREDVNNDEIVDFWDLISVAFHYGE